ncbi:selenoneine biosynthesis selenosugar synthase SenB [Polynucleobacter ibericus]|uniref:selenoneine biosynthesis selenosugar synthase SenB n=1 Tax=Polynucleobacter ibericus TaxID=1819725 RepID=UPI001BFEDB1C|nr:selenoneine biosynthesis selenosugar synthase SenB [Polynucleobacter ibericus]QWE08168.1 TIGR04348 family glycosyltransferase [Polynucleobacter ibericus]
MTPAPPGSLHGNRMTAMRWQVFLRDLGYVSRVTESWSGGDAGLLITLHAYRSYQSILQFKRQYPDRPVALVLTGTDLYRDMAIHDEVLQSMNLADALVVLQSTALGSIPPNLRHKAEVIFQSVEVGAHSQNTGSGFQVAVIGHLREEKDPFCIARSQFLMPADSQAHVLHMGKAMNPEMERAAKDYSNKLDRYRWMGELSHEEAMRILSESRLMVISSRMEGGAHVVSEAIALGVPIIASDIAGNRGLLGDDYPGYYPVADEAALATLIHQAETDAHFYSALKKCIEARKHLISPQQEQESIQKLLNKLMSRQF